VRNENEAKTKRNRFASEIPCFAKPLISLCSQNAEFRGFEGFQRLKRFAKRFLEFRVQKVFLMTTASHGRACCLARPSRRFSSIDRVVFALSCLVKKTIAFKPIPLPYDVDGRDKPGHDANESRSYHSFRFSGSHFPKFLTVPGMPPYFPDRRAISPRTSSRQPPPSQTQTLP